MSRLYLVVPLSNEVQNLDRLSLSFEKVVEEFSPRHEVQFVLVDGGSQNGTAERPRQLGGSLDLVLPANPTGQAHARPSRTWCRVWTSTTG